MKRRSFLKALGATLGAIALGIQLTVGEAVGPELVMSADFGNEPDWTGAIHVTSQEQADDLFGGGSNFSCTLLGSVRSAVMKGTLSA